MTKVLIGPMTLVNVDAPWLHALRNAGFDLVFPPKPVLLSEEDLLHQLKGIAASLAGSEPYTRRVLEAHPQLKVIARVGVGYDAVDLEAATDHGVVVTFAPNTNHDAVAEHTFALILALAKSLIPQYHGTKAGTWPRQATLPLRGRVLGVAGLGRIGKAVVLRAKVFGMKVMAYEPFPDQEFVAQQGIRLVPFETLLAESDWLSLHVPMTKESQYLINKKTLALMKPTAFLINTARGGLVCEADLLVALKAGKLGGAGLDVFEEEPARKNPLLELDNVVGTPHAAGVDLQSRDDMALSGAEAIIALSRGQWPTEKVVNPQVKAKFRW